LLEFYISPKETSQGIKKDEIMQVKIHLDCNKRNGDKTKTNSGRSEGECYRCKNLIDTHNDLWDYLEVDK
jgi:hypothetical protein